MKLTVLGGSAASVGTGQGCSGYLLESQGCRIVLDLGPGTLPELRRHTDYRTLDAIVISHMHVDHVLDLLALRFALAYNPVPAPRPIPLWLPPNGTATLQQAGMAFASSGSESDFYSPMLTIAEYDPEAALTIGEFTITFRRTVHPLACWAMRVAASSHPGRDLVYSADTGPSVDFNGFIDGCAVLLSEATMASSRQEPFDERIHLSGEDAGKLAATAGAEHLVLTHMFEESDPLEAQTCAATVFQGSIFRAMPGVTVEW